MPPASPTTPPRPRNLPKNVACNRCRDSRRPCNPGKPCDNCRHAKVECKGGHSLPENWRETLRFEKWSPSDEVHPAPPSPEPREEAPFTSNPQVEQPHMPPESIAGSFKSSSGRNDAKILPSTNDSPRKHSTSVTLDPSPKDKIPQTTHAPSETPINHHNPYILNGPPDLDQNLTIAPFHLPEATITELDSFHLNALPAQAHLIPSAQPGIAYTFNGWALADNAELVNIFLSLQPQIGLNLHPDRLRRLFIVDLFHPTCPLLRSHAPLIRESMKLVVALFASAPDGSLTALNRVREERTMLTQGMVHYFDAYSYLLAHEAVVTSLIMEGWYLLQKGLILHEAEKLFAHLNTHIELSGLQGFEQLSAPPLREAWLAIIPDPIHTAERVNLCWSVRALDLAVAQQLGTPPKTQLGNSDENVLSIRPVSYSGVEEMRAFSHGWWALISKSMHYEFMNQHQPMGP